MKLLLILEPAHQCKIPVRTASTLDAGIIRAELEARFPGYLVYAPDEPGPPNSRIVTAYLSPGRNGAGRGLYSKVEHWRISKYDTDQTATLRDSVLPRGQRG